MKHNRILPLALVTLAIAAACQKDDTATADTAAPAAATATTDSATSAFDVGDIDMGRRIDADRKIADKTDDFAPTDTIYASIHTRGGAAPVQLMARWTFEDSTVVGEDTQTVQAGQDTDTEFHLAKSGGLKKGKYTVHILADGNEVKTKEVTVK